MISIASPAREELKVSNVTDLFLSDLNILRNCPQSILDCESFNIMEIRNKFRKNLIKKSGIYMLKYKHNNQIFYIGKSVDLSRRLADHFIRSSLSSNRLGFFLKTVG